MAQIRRRPGALGDGARFPSDFALPTQLPKSVAEWQARSDAFLSHQCCAFHRNMEISSRYAWLYGLQPACFKWTAMASIASHHVRLALFPLRLDADGTGYVDIPRSLGRRGLLSRDVDTIRMTNNAIFRDIFWVHLAYLSADDGLAYLQSLLRGDSHYAPVLAGFELIDRGRRALEASEASTGARRVGEDLVWRGNLVLLEHEQRAVVQPNFDRLSCASARVVAFGSSTSFEVRGVRQELACFTSFYAYWLRQGLRESLRSRRWPRITRLDDRWRWLEQSVFPQFRRFDADPELIGVSLGRIADEARRYQAMRCMIPRPRGGSAGTAAI